MKGISETGKWINKTSYFKEFRRLILAIISGRLIFLLIWVVSVLIMSWVAIASTQEFNTLLKIYASYSFWRGTLFGTYNANIPDRLGWSRTNLENRERFFLSDASQVSAMVGDHSRQMKTRICTIGDRSMIDFTHYQSSKLLGDYSIYLQNLGLSVKAKNRGTQGRFFPK